MPPGKVPLELLVQPNVVIITPKGAQQVDHVTEEGSTWRGDLTGMVEMPD